MSKINVEYNNKYRCWDAYYDGKFIASYDQYESAVALDGFDSNGEPITHHCKHCIHFQRGKWDKSIDSDESEQLGGHCKVLLEVLSITNSNLWSMEKLHVQESFGCSLFKEKNA